MLNELYKFSKSLEHHGLLQSITHPNINNIMKDYCLRIEINKSGIPVGARLLQKDETTVLWKHSKGNYNSFPAIRIQNPLLAASESVKIDQTIWQKAKLPEKVALLYTLDYGAVNSECSDIKITNWSLSELDPVKNSTQPELSALRTLISLFPKSEQTAAFVTRLLLFFHSAIRYFENEQQVDFVKELLVGHFDKKNGKYTSGCMTYYDVYETSDYQNLIASMETRYSLTNLLNIQSEKNTEQVISNLSGQASEPIGDKYPNPNLPLLGQTYLFSKKFDIPCLTRYNLKGTGAFISGKDEIMAINDALAFFTDKTRLNKTWKAMSDSNREKPNLLFAYLPDDPQNNAYLAQILCDPSDYGSEDEYREESIAIFEALCEQVLGNIKSVIQKNPQSKIEILMLEMLDAGRKQVVYENNLSAVQFRNNLLNWHEAARNLPPLAIRVNDKKSIITYTPVCPGPNDICQLLKLNYTHSGSAKPMKQSAVSLHEIYRLYMPAEDYFIYDIDFIRDILRRVMEKTSRIIGDTGGQLTVGYALPPAKESHTRAKQVVLSISLISILLWRLNVRKESYMLGAPFNIGQFLQLADMLHKEYCIQVRNSGNKSKAIPTQLMGNEVLAITAENPIEGLNRLRDRMKIYLAWANTAVGEGTGLAKWVLARYSEVSLKIAAHDLPEQFNAADQAQVLLGYLAAIPFEKKNDKESEKNE